MISNCLIFKKKMQIASTCDESVETIDSIKTVVGTGLDTVIILPADKPVEMVYIWHTLGLPLCLS